MVPITTTRIPLVFNDMVISRGCAPPLVSAASQLTLAQHFAHFRDLDTGEHLKSALKADPEMLLGHYVFGVFFMLFGVPALAKRAESSLQKAREIAAAQGATARENRLLDA